jgi:hypothetical protein
MNTENNMIIGNESHGPDGAVAALSTSDPGLPACFYKGVGKVARLPVALRQELNRRLLNGEEGRQLVAWLNGLPEVQAMLAAHFHGQPIGEMNLSRWKNGGFMAWCEQQGALMSVATVFEHSHDLQQAARNGLIARMNMVLTARLARELQRLDAMREGDDKTKACRELVGTLSVLKRGEVQDERLRLEREKLALRRQAREEEVWKWSQRERIQTTSRERSPAADERGREVEELMEAKAEHQKSIRRTLGRPAESAADPIGANAK